MNIITEIKIFTKNLKCKFVLFENILFWFGSCDTRFAKIPININNDIVEGFVDIVNNNNILDNNNYGLIVNIIGDILNNNRNLNVNNYDLFRQLFDIIRDLQNNNIRPDNYMNYVNNHNLIVNH